MEHEPLEILAWLIAQEFVAAFTECEQALLREDEEAKPLLVRSASAA